MMFARVAALLTGLVAFQLPAFRTAARLVVLHVTVRGAHGEPVTQLDRGAFTVYENGKPQPVTLFRRDDVPASIGLLIDNSGSMRSRRPTVEAAALGFARASNPDDELFVLNFADKARLDVPFTRDRGALEAGIARLDGIGGTAMRDAIEAGAAYLAKAAHDRKALLVVTDGQDNSSVAALDDVLKRAERDGTTIYAIGLLKDAHAAAARHARDELDRLTRRTGGVAYYPATLDAVQPIALEIARQIRQQYTLAYAPLNQTLDGSYRAIRVAVAHPDRLTVLTRAGYYAAPPTE